MMEALKDRYAGSLYTPEVLLRDLSAPLLVRRQGVSHGGPWGFSRHWVD